MKQFAMLLVALFVPVFLLSQSKSVSTSTFAGVWELVAVKSLAKDSSISYPYGEQPAGIKLLTSTGDYAIEIYRVGRPQVASGNKTTATAAENEMMVKGCNAHFGRYSFDTTMHIASFSIQQALFPNWEGTVLNQQYSVNENTLSFTSAVSTFGASVAIVEWRRKQ